MTHTTKNRSQARKLAAILETGKPVSYQTAHTALRGLANHPGKRFREARLMLERHGVRIITTPRLAKSGKAYMEYRVDGRCVKKAGGVV